MALYQFNMARGQVLTLEKRRLWFRWVFAYLGVSVVVIAAVAYKLSADLVDLSERRASSNERERQFLKERPGASDLDASLRRVTSELVCVSTSLEAVAQFRTIGQKSADIVLGFAEALPKSVDLGKLSLDGVEGTVKVEVYVPVSLKQEGGLTLPSMISRWESSPLLTNRVSKITSENSERVNFEGRNFQNWRFTGVLERNAK